LSDGKFAAGESNVQSVLTDAQARAMREIRYEFGLTQGELAKMYRICRSAVSMILRGKTYVGAGGPVEEGRPRRDKK
jgi:hypothetical protein